MKDYPLIKFILFFIPGIAAGKYLTAETGFTPILIAAITIVLILLLLKFYKSDSILLLLIYSFSFLTGYIWFQGYSSDKDYILPQSIQKERNFKIFGSITNIELLRQNEIVFTCETDSINLNNKNITCKPNILCRVKNDSRPKLMNLYSEIYPGYEVSLSGTYNKGRERRNPDEFDYNDYLNERGISGILISYNPGDLRVTLHSANYFKSLIFECRKYLSTVITNLHNKETAGLLNGLVLGDRSEMDYETKDNFINTGTVHVLSVSGLHVAYISLIFLFLFGRFNPYLKGVFIAAGLFVYMLITGFQPAVLRSTIMAVVVLIAYLTNRSTNIFNSLALAALIILAINPTQLFDPGFQLSFSAVLSIAIFYPVFKHKIEAVNINSPWIKKLLLFIAVSVSAQIGTLPFTLYYFSKLSLIAIFTNLLVVPLTGVILAIAIFTLLIGVFSVSLAGTAAVVNELLTQLLYFLVNSSGEWSYSFLPIRQFSVSDALIFYTFLAILFYSISRVRHWAWKIVLCCIIFFNTILFCSFDDEELLSADELNLMMIDVGQGDAMLLKFPDGQTALVDAGEATAYFDNGERVIMPLLNYLGIDKVDYGIISHMDKDHYSGFVSLIHNGRIRRVIKPFADSTRSADLKFEMFCLKNRIPIEHHSKNYLNSRNVKIYFLSDDKNPYCSGWSGNDKSALIKIVYGKTSFLFTGDIGKRGEYYYSEIYKELLKTDVLKVSHHGSNTGSTVQFLDDVNPSVSLISAGFKNKYNLPSHVVINRLTRLDSKIHRTDLEGAVLYKSNGDSVYQVNWRE